MAIIYDMNYINKCRYNYQKCLDVVAKSKQYYEETLNEQSDTIIGKVRKTLYLRGYKFANRFSTNCAIYWARREIVAIKKGALNR